MPLPDHPITLEGGCNCRAIRYRVSIPAKEDRPPYLLGGNEVEPKVQAPIIVTDHCNDCRTATGAIMQHWLLAPMSMVSFSLVERSASVPTDLRLEKDFPRPGWEPASKTCEAPEPSPSNYHVFFKSSPARRRHFCSRCGTMFGYNAFPMPEHIKSEPFLDIVLGTIDREFLEQEWMKPEKQMWWGCGIPWVMKQSLEGLDLPVHPKSDVRYIVEKPHEAMGESSQS